MSLHIHKNHLDERAKSIAMQFLKFDIKKLKHIFEKSEAFETGTHMYDKSPIGIFILYLYL